MNADTHPGGTPGSGAGDDQHPTTLDDDRTTHPVDVELYGEVVEGEVDAELDDDGAPLDPDDDQVDEHPHGLYLTAAALYRRLGWSSALPLPDRAKFPPPEGWTGWGAPDPSPADAWSWATEDPVYRGTGNLALRMPDGVIGIDVDHYGDKRGADTIAEAERRWGPLPPAPRSSARGAESPSGIRFYSVPPGTALRGKLAFRDLGLGDVEIIQRVHRYALAWPSIHPSGRPVVWIDTAGPDLPPNATKLLPLPDAWLAGLVVDKTAGELGADPEAVRAFALDHALGGPHSAASLRGMVRVFDSAAAAGGRHDALIEAACMAAREARAGKYPAGDARGALRDAWMRAMGSPAPGARKVTPAEARREFDSCWSWGVGQALAIDVDVARERSRPLDDDAMPKGRKLTSALSSSAAPPLPGQMAPRVGPGSATAGATIHAEVREPVDRPPLRSVPSEDADAATWEEYAAAAAEQLAEQEAARIREAIRVRIEQLDVADAAKRERELRDREPLRVLRGGAFLDAPVPEYLVPRMLYRDGLAVMFGAPGAAKSFVALDLALCVATGTPWRGRSLGHDVVHYVMAEGQATNTLRAKAWLKHNDVDPAELGERFVAIPSAILLTEGGVAEYLDVVREDRPRLIVFDTKNLMFAGKESQGEDYGAMLRVLHSIREAAGGASVVLIDHSGLGDDTRVRGNNAQKGGIDTEIRVVEDAQGVRRVEITRDKSGVVGARWAFRLQQVEGVPHPIDVQDPAVCVPVDEDEQTSERALRSSCWDVARADLPEALRELTGKTGEAAQDVFRALTEVRDVDGLTRAAILSLVKESPREHKRTAGYAAVAELVARDVLLAINGSRYVLAPQYLAQGLAQAPAGGEQGDR